MNEEIDEYEKKEFFLAQNSYNSIPINSNQYIMPLSRNEREILDKQVLLEDCIVEDRNKCTIQLVKYKLNWENNQTQNLDYYGNIENLKNLYKNGSVTSCQKVANFVADKVEVIQCPKDYGYTILLKIYCKVRIGNDIHNREVYISYKDFLEENIRNCFKKADIICFRLNKNINSLLKEYLNQYIHIDIINYSIPYRSGFFKEMLCNMVAIYLKEVISKDNLAKFPLENSTGFIPCHTDDFSIKRIKLGTDDNGYNIYWSLGNLNNKHILLAGRSGSGKSYCICNIIQSLHDLKHNVIILDFSRSYIQSKHNNHPIFDSGIIHNHDLKSILENNSLEIVLDDISNECGSVNRFALFSQDEDLDTNIKYFLRTLFKYCQEHDSFEITLVIDEIQKINIDINHPLNDIISEGRKFDMMLALS